VTHDTIARGGNGTFANDRAKSDGVLKIYSRAGAVKLATWNNVEDALCDGIS
jgi:hypothetical protein